MRKRKKGRELWAVSSRRYTERIGKMRISRQVVARPTNEWHDTSTSRGPPLAAAGKRWTAIQLLFFFTTGEKNKSLHLSFTKCCVALFFLKKKKKNGIGKEECSRECGCPLSGLRWTAAYNRYNTKPPRLGQMTLLYIYTFLSFIHPPHLVGWQKKKRSWLISIRISRKK